VNGADVNYCVVLASRRSGGGAWVSRSPTTSRRAGWPWAVTRPGLPPGATAGLSSSAVRGSANMVRSAIRRGALDDWQAGVLLRGTKQATPLPDKQVVTPAGVVAMPSPLSVSRSSFHDARPIPTPHCWASQQWRGANCLWTAVSGDLTDRRVPMG
jgi:hypothetical protein